MNVYNRWGNEEFSGSSKSFPGWDGKRNNEKPVNEDTYFYLLISHEEKCYEKGFITVLLRRNDLI